MIDLLPDFLVNEPRRLKALGQALVWMGTMILILGAIGQVATVGQSALHSIGGRSSAPPMLADIYPALPTWFVPESLFGCLPAVLLIVAGWKANALGKDLLKFV